MKFVADENVDLPILVRLRNDGHEIDASVVEEYAAELENAFTVITHHNLRIRPRI